MGGGALTVAAIYGNHLAADKDVSPFQAAHGTWSAAPDETLETVLCRWQIQMGSKAARLLLPASALAMHPAHGVKATGTVEDGLSALSNALPKNLLWQPVVWRYDGTIGVFGAIKGQAPEEVLFRACPAGS